MESSYAVGTRIKEPLESVVFLILGQAGDAGKLVKPRIKTQDPVDSVLFHHGKMDRISRRQPCVSQYNFFCTLYHIPIDGQDLIDDSE